MTSFLIKAHVDRPASVWGSNLTSDENCTFCKIIERSVDAAVVYETDRVIAILDILPLRPGHTLVIPKTHCSRVSELPAEYARAVGEAVSVVAKALTEALENTGLNVVCNQEYAQAVPHVRRPLPCHTGTNICVVGPSPFPPKPEPAGGDPPSQRAMHRMEFESRSELDDDDAAVLVRKIRSKL
ncbi:HIT-like protein [Mycena kentingensis (nom. inval.)]|nr:HIT-like protein [Mycena kentingensis (nom. inval.)]